MELSHRFVHMGMGQYLLIPFLVGWTSIYQLFWGSLGTRVLTHPHVCPIVFPIDLFIDKLRHPSRSQSIEVHRPLELQLRCEASRNRPCAGGGTRRPGTTWGLMEGRNGKLTCFYGVVTCNHGWRYILSYIYIYISYIYMYIIYIYIYIHRNGSEYEFRIMPYSEVVTTGGLVRCSTAVLPGSWSCKGLVLGSSASGLTKSAQFVCYDEPLRKGTDQAPYGRTPALPIHSTDP